MSSELITGQVNTLLKILAGASDAKAAIEKMSAYIFKDEGECKAFLDYLEKSTFYTDPASTTFHGSFKGGLAQHTLCVTGTALRLATAFCDEWAVCNTPKAKSADSDLLFDDDEEVKEPFTAFEVFVAAVSHDFCKIGLYESFFRNVKNAKGEWEKIASFKTKGGIRNLGHGGESVLRLLKVCPSLIENRTVLEAVKAHMGAWDASENERKSLGVLMDNPLVLLLQTADQIASAWYKC